MSIKPRKRVGAIDILQNDFEYCTISYYSESSINELGEPNRELKERDSNVKCSIDAVPKGLSNEKGYFMALQGYAEDITNYMVLNAEQEVEKGDIVTDYNGTTYKVLSVYDWHTHKDVFLRKIA